MPIEKIIRHGDDTIVKLVSQRDTSGKVEHFRHTTQEMQGVIDHVNLHKEINEAPKKGNPNGWHYIGSIPIEILMDWLRDNRITVDAFARNEDDCKTKFKKWFLGNRDLRKFNAEKC